MFYVIDAFNQTLTLFHVSKNFSRFNLLFDKSVFVNSAFW
jgi:hypothetical protein